MNELISILLYVFSILIAYRVGWRAREIHTLTQLAKLDSQIETQLEEIKEKEVIRISIEKHSNGFFVYNMEDNSFMAQGTTRMELEKNLLIRFPGKKFAAKEENLIAMGFLHNESV